jgi:hypothetical protein
MTGQAADLRARSSTGEIIWRVRAGRAGSHRHDRAGLAGRLAAPLPTMVSAAPASQPYTEAPGRTSQPGWDRAARAAQLDREVPSAGFDSATGASAPPRFGGSARPGGPGFRSPAGSGFRSPAGPGFGSPAGGGASGDFGTAGPGASPISRGAETDPPPQPKIAPSGLPVRQPRAARPASPAPLSPSGSLWEPVSGDARDPASQSAETQDQASPPIFVWSPATSPESSSGRQGE